jgi:GntR family transcriptional repressor for pyruvate dehydrogenase complex
MEKRQRVSEVVSKEIQEMILSKLNSGDKLPSETELASMYGVSRSSIREALQALESIGIVEKRNGGTYVTSSPKDCLVEPLSLMIQMNFARLSDVLDMRRLLEIEAVRLAALNAGKDDIRNLENLVWLMQRPDLSREEFIELDIQFHYAIAEATGNNVLYQLIKDIIAVISKLLNRVCSMANDVPEITIPLHKKTLEGIKTKNVDLALAGMVEHLENSEDSVREEYLVNHKMAAK